MNFNLKKIFFNLLLNSTLFLILIIGIQNYSKRSKVNFIVNESINLPIGFIVGVSFISGSITGGFLTLNIWEKD
tara:strand:+ start:3749 stop:3970 length:222 start_codon:yes stop_codon:yes gene_type:complete